MFAVQFVKTSNLQVYSVSRGFYETKLMINSTQSWVQWNVIFSNL